MLSFIQYLTEVQTKQTFGDGDKTYDVDGIIRRKQIKRANTRRVSDLINLNGELTNAEGNFHELLRNPTPEFMARVKKADTRFPIHIDTKGNVIDGSHRLAALHFAGERYAKVQVVGSNILGKTKLTEAKTRPDAMQSFDDRALARMRSQSPPAKSPLASLGTSSEKKYDNKYWYQPDTQNLVSISGNHDSAVLKDPNLFGVVDSPPRPIHAAIRNGWVRLDSSKHTLTVQGTKSQSHKVIRDHYSSGAGQKEPFYYYVEHHIDDETSSHSHGGVLTNPQDIEHYINNFGTPPMGAEWTHRTPEPR